jgi:hypothetical protein
MGDEAEMPVIKQLALSSITWGTRQNYRQQGGFFICLLTTESRLAIYVTA